MITGVSNPCKSASSMSSGAAVFVMGPAGSGKVRNKDRYIYILTLYPSQS